jgi:hypothetical protein
MTEKVRCPSCRGSKKVPKLGGVVGDCNTCNGEGQILAAHKVVIKVVDVNQIVSTEFISAVADSIPASTLDDIKTVINSPEAFGEALESIKRVAKSVPNSDVKIDGKKALYKRKRA